MVSKIRVRLSLLVVVRASSGTMIPAMLRRRSTGFPESWAAKPEIDSGDRTSRPMAYDQLLRGVNLVSGWLTMESAL